MRPRSDLQAVRELIKHRALPASNPALPPHKRRRVPVALFPRSDEGFWQVIAGGTLAPRVLPIKLDAALTPEL